MADYEGPQMTSSEFRRTYAKIGTPTMVTVNGHIIGVWVPSSDGTTISIKMGDLHLPDPINHAPFEPAKRRIEVNAFQAERDAILRKINRGG